METKNELSMPSMSFEQPTMASLMGKLEQPVLGLKVCPVMSFEMGKL